MRWAGYPVPRPTWRPSKPTIRPPTPGPPSPPCPPRGRAWPPSGWTAVSPAAAISTRCALPSTDVFTTDYHYPAVQWLYCANIISGYSSSPPCANAPCFLPGNPTTRGQLTKLVALAFGFDISNPGPQIFADVPPDYPF